MKPRHLPWPWSKSSPGAVQDKATSSSTFTASRSTILHGGNMSGWGPAGTPSTEKEPPEAARLRPHFCSFSLLPTGFLGAFIWILPVTPKQRRDKMTSYSLPKGLSSQIMARHFQTLFLCDVFGKADCLLSNPSPFICSFTQEVFWRHVLCQESWTKQRLS